MWRSDNADVKLCYLVDIQQRFFVPPCLHLQSEDKEGRSSKTPTGEPGFDSR
jgi:hypothetical protein